MERRLIEMNCQELFNEELLQLESRFANEEALSGPLIEMFEEHHLTSNQISKTVCWTDEFSFKKVGWLYKISIYSTLFQNTAV